MDSSPVWRLRQGARTVAEIEITGSDFPWLEGRLRPRPGFAPWAAVFAEELALLRADGEPTGEQLARSEELYERVNAELTLVAPDGDAVSEFLLHVDGDQAWFRWID
ncbi:MAG TPA: hypothetical protein VKZ89_04820 [Thermobifida alba]|nr:hypothetical protein [Thermobifida alba]